MRSDRRPGERLGEVIPLLIDVQHNLDCELPLETLARDYGYSSFHFHRFFTSTVGETPKQHVDRLRLERAAYKLAITSDSVLDIALSVGFQNHETFSRAFKRAFGYTPRDYRQACRAAQKERMERNCGFRGEGCHLSEVRFVTLPATTLLAIRRYGAYADFDLRPFLEGDEFGGEMVSWAKRRNLPYQPLALVISYDDPTVTPGPLQRLDICIPMGGRPEPEGRIRVIDFAGGPYAVIQHAGPLDTIDQAYRSLADGIRRSSEYDFDEGPPVQVYHKFRIGGDPSANVTDVSFPVRRIK